MNTVFDSEVVASLLFARIASGELERDEIDGLQPLLARDLKLHQTDIRAAIGLLEAAETACDIDQVGALFARVGDLSSVAAVQGWRHTLLRNFVSEAVRRSTAQDFHELRRFANQFAATSCQEPLKLLRADVAFHQRLAMASGCSMLLLLLSDSLHAQMLRTSEFLRIHPPSGQVAQYHRQLLQALFERDAAACYRAVESYFIVHRVLDKAPPRARDEVATPPAAARMVAVSNAKQIQPQSGRDRVPSERLLMAKQHPIQEIITRLRQDLDDLQSVLPSLLEEAEWAAQARTALGNLLPGFVLPSSELTGKAATTTQAGSAKKAETATPVKRGRRPKVDNRGGGELMPETVMHAIGQLSPGPKVGDIASFLSVETDAVKRVLLRLRDQNQLRVEGIKRQTRYFAAEASPAPARPVLAMGA